MSIEGSLDRIWRRSRKKISESLTPISSFDAESSNLNWLTVHLWLDNTVTSLANRVFWFIPFLTRGFIPD